MKHMEEPKIPDLTAVEVVKEAVKWKVRLWSQEVDIYCNRRAALEENKGALYAVLMDEVLKIIKLKLESNTGYTKADEMNDSVWLLESLEDIMIDFEDENPKTLAIDDQMERILTIKQE